MLAIILFDSFVTHVTISFLAKERIYLILYVKNCVMYCLSGNKCKANNMHGSHTECTDLTQCSKYFSPLPVLCCCSLQLMIKARSLLEKVTFYTFYVSSLL